MFLTAINKYMFFLQLNLVDFLKDKEVDCGGAPPRVLVLDDYFMTEVEKVEKDPDTGRGVKTKVSLTCSNKVALSCSTRNLNGLILMPLYDLHMQR